MPYFDTKFDGEFSIGEEWKFGEGDLIDWGAMRNVVSDALQNTLPEASFFEVGFENRKLNEAGDAFELSGPVVIKFGLLEVFGNDVTWTAGLRDVIKSVYGDDEYRKRISAELRRIADELDA